jgi:putative ABC transport system permease protein
MLLNLNSPLDHMRLCIKHARRLISLVLARSGKVLRYSCSSRGIAMTTERFATFHRVTDSGARFIDGSWRDLLLACRSLRATPIVTLVAIASLVLGIGANTAIFSVTNSLLLRTLPVRDPSRLVLISDAARTHVRAWSYPIWEQVRQRPELFERSAAWSFTRFNLSAGGETQFIDGIWASGSFFEALGVPALLGRTFSDRDDVRGGGPEGPVAVIGYGFWQRRFGGAPDIVGRTLSLDGASFTIVGVTRPEFTGPEVGRMFDAIVPLGTEPLVRGSDSFLDDSGVTFLTMIARLGTSQSEESATAGLRQVQSQIRDATLGDIGRFGSREAIDRYLKAPFALVPGAMGFAGARDLRELYQRPLLTLTLVVAFLLLIACVNVANLLTARAIARRHELSLRLALGASRARLVRQLLAESAVLYGIGAAGGLLLAAWTSGALVRQLSTAAYPVFLDVSVDGRILAFTVGITVLTTVIFGTAPAFRASGIAPIDALKEHQRGVVGRPRPALSDWLVIVQIALSLVLVFAAGLFVRTFASLTARPLGFDPARVLLVDIDAHRTANDVSQRIALYERAREATRALPDVAESALSLTTPVGSGQFTPLVEIGGVSDTRGPVWANLISPGWFSTFQIPLVAGRDLTDGDRAGTPRVAVVNEAFARKFSEGKSPLGLTISLYPHTPRTLGPVEIVGVVGDAVYSSLRAPAPPTFYIPLAQFDYLPELGIRSINLNVRSRGASPLGLTKGVAGAIAHVNPELSLTFRPLASQVSDSLTQERLTALLSGSFGALALLLAGLGLYGVTMYSVASRRMEIGVRMALGASTSAVARLVLSRAAVLVCGGVLFGTAISVWASRFVATLIYGLAPRDTTTLVASAMVLIVVAGCAAWVPTRRAIRTQPAVVLRDT